MQLAIVGVSHKTAPVEVRERLAFPSEQLRTALASVRERAQAAEAMIISTCNRVEILAEGPIDPLREFICHYHRIPAEAISKHLYTLNNTDPIRHVFRATSTLASI